ncbi:MAG TPA: DUF309 domain-containing protein [Candidatus Polarisedimenticolia bacterium]|nr:DUF309 domain-containing protein [Candidatus Polarisedimenticolia bacterium]
MATDFREALRRGADLFNRRRFFEAHEAWEERWLIETGEARLLLHGLIQVAAGFVKLQRGAPRGAVLNLEKGAARLERLPPGCLRVDLAGLLGSVARWRRTAAEMAAAGRSAYDATALPHLDLREDEVPEPPPRGGRPAG